MTDYILFKNLDGKYMTLPECLEVNKTDRMRSRRVLWMRTAKR